MEGVWKDVKMEFGRKRVRFLEEWREWRLPGLFYADDLVNLEEDLRTMVRGFLRCVGEFTFIYYLLYFN